LETARFRLLESAAEALARALLAHASIERVRVKLTKPEALGNGALASLTIERARVDDAHEPGA
jgi:dihydroneopterin aldolase